MRMGMKNQDADGCRQNALWTTKAKSVMVQMKGAVGLPLGSYSSVRIDGGAEEQRRW